MFNWLITHSPLLYYTQSLWRDEAFSILAAEKPLMEILPKLSFEPPVYYILLHFWIKIFGESEIAARSLSFLGFALATVVIIFWAEKLFKKHWLSWFLPLTFFFNPMLIYYAFEVRAYGWYIFFAVLSMFAYLEKRWILYIVAGVLGFYTHTYFGIVIFVEALHWFIFNRKNFSGKRILGEPMFKSTVAVGILILPWLIKIGTELSALKNSWYFPVNIQLVMSVLGNMFLGYEGTPGYLWGATQALSLILLIFFCFALKLQKTRVHNSFFFLMVTVPLIIVIGISFVKPLFVNRYLIGVTVAEVILSALAIEALGKAIYQKIAAGAVIIFIVAFNIWYPWQHRKLDIRVTVNEINSLKANNDLYLVDNPLVFFETLYYSKDRSKVFLFNPNHSPFPWYVGGAVFDPSRMTDKIPSYPQKAFVIHANGTYTVEYQMPINRILLNPKPKI